MSKRVLLDTNIIVHRERGDLIYIKDIGTLFNWLDKLHYEKCIHPDSQRELEGHKDPRVVETMLAKIRNYNVLKTVSKDDRAIESIRVKYDNSRSDEIDTNLVREVYNGRVDYLITEDRRMHRKAAELNIGDKLFTVETFLEKCVLENPELTDYKVLSIKKTYFGDLNIDDTFFESFKEDYKEFADWFNRKSDKVGYVCTSENGILAFLYLKKEEPDEPYHDIQPQFAPALRLKIGTFKVSLNGYKLGERFMKIIFDNAFRQKVVEIYVTVFGRTSEQELLIKLLEDWGFYFYGSKTTENGVEKVYVRNFRPHFNAEEPQKSYPYISKSRDAYFVPIKPGYHTELLPDSHLKTEDPRDYLKNKPNRNAIRKVYVSRSIERNMKKGDIVIFYRTKDTGAGFYTSVATTIGIVDSVILNIKDEEQFLSLCRKRSVFTDEELRERWNEKSWSRPFIVNFLYVYSLPTPKLTLGQLKEYGIIAEAPRGFQKITKEAFEQLIEKSNAEKSFIVD